MRCGFLRVISACEFCALEVRCSEGIFSTRECFDDISVDYDGGLGGIYLRKGSSDVHDMGVVVVVVRERAREGRGEGSILLSTNSATARSSLAAEPHR